VLWRIASSYGTVRCPERVDWEFLRYVWRFNKVERPKTVAAFQASRRISIPWCFAATAR
jgi:hypothetical protein